MVVYLPPQSQSAPPASCHAFSPRLSLARTPWALDLDGLSDVQQVSFASFPPVAFLCRKRGLKKPQQTSSSELRKTREQKVKCKSRAPRLEMTIFVATENGHLENKIKNRGGCHSLLGPLAV